MTMTRLKLVTIITEDEIEHRLINDLKRLGVTGYTIGKVRGEGHHRVRASEWEGENVMVEVLAGEELAGRIFALLGERYFGHFGVTAYQMDVEVARGDKYR